MNCALCARPLLRARCVRRATLVAVALALAALRLLLAACWACYARARAHQAAILLARAAFVWRLTRAMPTQKRVASLASVLYTVQPMTRERPRRPYRERLLRA